MPLVGVAVSDPARQTYPIVHRPVGFDKPVSKLIKILHKLNVLEFTYKISQPIEIL
jgi:hypothetical protein